jgi:hypothetical protein
VGTLAPAKMTHLSEIDQSVVLTAYARLAR